MEPLSLLVLQGRHTILTIVHNLHPKPANKNTAARYLRASFAHDIELSPSLDNSAGVTQLFDGRAHTHRFESVAIGLSRASAQS